VFKEFRPASFSSTEAFVSELKRYNGLPALIEFDRKVVVGQYACGTLDCHAKSMVQIISSRGMIFSTGVRGILSISVNISPPQSG